MHDPVWFGLLVGVCLLFGFGVITLAWVELLKWVTKMWRGK